MLIFSDIFKCLQIPDVYVYNEFLNTYMVKTFKREVCEQVIERVKIRNRMKGALYQA